MRFYSLAVCGVLCALSRMSHGRNTNEELDWQVKNLDCPPGQQPSKIIEFSSNGWLTKFECINRSLKNDQERFKPREKQETTRAPNKVKVLESEVPNTECPFGSTSVIVWTSCLKGTKDSRDCKHAAVRCLLLRGFWMDANPKASGSTPPPNTVEELDDEIMPTECPFAHRPVNMSPFSPSNAAVTTGCTPSKMMACVPVPFGNNPASLRLLGQQMEIGQLPKTEAELNFEMAPKACVAGQRPMRISPWCRKGANDIIDCGHAEVWCVQQSFTAALKTVEELEREILDMICPADHQPTLIRGMCPIGSKRSTDCEESRKACRPVPVDERHSFRKFNGWNRNHRGHWGRGFRRGPGWRRWRGRN